MHPPYELIRLGAADASEADLRRVARAHPQAQMARFRSRSYRPPLALVAWHERPLGVDLERVEPFEAGFGESICTPQELAQHRHRLGDPGFVASLWSSKEALAKALGEALAYDPRRLESPICWPEGAAGRWRAVALTPAPGHVAWLVWEQPSPGR